MKRIQQGTDPEAAVLLTFVDAERQAYTKAGRAINEGRREEAEARVAEALALAEEMRLREIGEVPRREEGS
jgi:hypothetical protein